MRKKEVYAAFINSGTDEEVEDSIVRYKSTKKVANPCEEIPPYFLFYLLLFQILNI